MAKRLYGIAQLLFGIALAIVLVAVVLPWAAENGYAGYVIQQNVIHDRDASALFYTESERAMQIINAFEKQQ